MSSLADEPIIKRSPRGQAVAKTVKKIKDQQFDGIAVLMLTQLGNCLYAGKKHRLPSLGEAAVWTAFQRIRNGEEILGAWKAFMEKSNLQAEEVDFTVQLFLDRAIKKMLSNIADCMLTTTQLTSNEEAMTPLQSNAVRYMAGYVSIKLLKRYRRTYKNKKVQFKHKLFVQTLEKMRAYQQPGDPDTISDYSTLWTELIDRGGLYQIDNDVFKLFESIEMVVRHHLNTTTFDPTVDINCAIRHDVLKSQFIMNLWEDIACVFPSRYEQYSIELFTHIINLWTSIRGHSFAEGWTMKFERKFKQKGTRKTLQPENVD